MQATHLIAVRSVGRPFVHTEPWTKITIEMQMQHVVYLDVVRVSFRQKHPGQAMSRAALVRALVQFMAQSGIDFTQFRNADEITQYLIGYFRAIPQRTRLPLLESRLSNSKRRRRGRPRVIAASPIAK